MKGYIHNIEEETLANTNFRSVLYTDTRLQLVVMTIAVGEDIGLEVHADRDQFIRIEAGEARVILNGEETMAGDGFAIIIPAGVEHNIVNTGSTPLRLYTLYCPPEHKDGTIHVTKADALAHEEHFDGKTTE